MIPKGAIVASKPMVNRVNPREEDKWRVRVARYFSTFKYPFLTLFLFFFLFFFSLPPLYTGNSIQGMVSKHVREIRFSRLSIAIRGKKTVELILFRQLPMIARVFSGDCFQYRCRDNEMKEDFEWKSEKETIKRKIERERKKIM